jgi:hypothetical protein
MSALDDVRNEILQMVADGLLEHTGEFRARQDGTMAPVYRLTALGTEVAELIAGEAEGEQ